MGIIKRQGIYNTLITYLGISLGFINLLVIQPQFLSKEEIGLTRLLFSFSALLATFMPLGVNSITLKYFPNYRNPEKKHFGFLGLALLITTFGYISFSLILSLFKPSIIANYQDQSELFTHYFNYIFPFTFFLCFINLLNSYCFSNFKTTIPSFLNDIITRILSVLLFILYSIKELSLDNLIFLFVGIYGLQFLFLLIYTFAFDRYSLRIDISAYKKNDVREMVIYGLLLSVGALSSLGLKYVDVVLLGKYVSLPIVGIYAISAFIPSVIEAPLMAIEKIGLATIANSWVHNKMDIIKEVYYKSARYLLLFGGLLFLGINLNIDQLFLVVADQSFSSGAIVVFILSLSTLANLASGVNDSIIYTSGKYKFGVFLLILILAYNYLMNIYLIPRYGMTGAAIATASSSIIYNLMKYLFIWKKFSLQPFGLTNLKIILVIIVLYIGIDKIPVLLSPIADIVLRSGLITFSYLLIMWLLKVIPTLNPLLLLKDLQKKDS